MGPRTAQRSQPASESSSIVSCIGKGNGEWEWRFRPVLLRWLVDDSHRKTSAQAGAAAAFERRPKAHCPLSATQHLPASQDCAMLRQVRTTCKHGRYGRAAGQHRLPVAVPVLVLVPVHGMAQIHNSTSRIAKQTCA